jgi:hypothetical protein
MNPRRLTREKIRRSSAVRRDSSSGSWRAITMVLQ